MPYKRNKSTASNPFLALEDLYEPLDGSFDFRVLRLFPAESRDEPIRCRLQVASLAKTQDRNYEAVSYCWGYDEESNLIYLNDRKFYVRDNLYDFLRYRRDKAETLVLWIDALCINQGDLEEKQRQVQLMRGVYLCADVLTIWLGIPSDNADLAIASIISVVKGDDAKLPYLPAEHRSALKAFLERPWWTRIWIVQEFVLGSFGGWEGAATFRCGDWIIPLVAFRTFIERVDDYQVENRQHLPSIWKINDLYQLRRAIEGTDWIASVRKLESGKSPDSAPTLLDLLVKYRQYQASDARDKIYALHGLARREDAIWRSVEINYEIPAAELYTKLAKLVILEQNSLSLLQYCRGKSLKGLPSWVPDWSSFRPGHTLQAAAALEDDDHEGDEDDNDMKASPLVTEQNSRKAERGSLFARIKEPSFGARLGSGKANYSPRSIQGDTLHMSAVIVDQIKTLHEAFPDEIETQWQNCTELMVAIGECKKLALDRGDDEPNPYLTDSGRESAFWATIFGLDIDGYNDNLREELSQQYKKWLPPIPTNWEAGDPPVTVLSSGLLHLAVFAAMAGDACVMVGQGMQTNLIPRDWDERKIEVIGRRFKALGQRWTTQPYDLRCRPFNLPNVVPDPYLESRPTQYHYLSKESQSKDSKDCERERIELPRVTLYGPEEDRERGSYKAALGRSFFITDGGYMGLAPPDAKIGDAIAALDGSESPYILRRAKSVNNQYKLVGEAYVETMVDAKVIDQRLQDLSLDVIDII